MNVVKNEKPKLADNVLILTNVRGSYVNFKVKYKDKYSMRILLNKTDSQIQKIRDMVKIIAIGEFGINASGLKLPLHHEPNRGPEYVDTCFFNARTKELPMIRNQFNKDASESDLEQYCYSGAFFHICCSFYPFRVHDKQGKLMAKGVGIGLSHLMLHREGPRLTNRENGETVFSDLAIEYVDDNGEIHNNANNDLIVDPNFINHFEPENEFKNDLPWG